MDGNKRDIAWKIGLIASVIAIFIFITGWQNIGDVFRNVFSVNTIQHPQPAAPNSVTLMPTKISTRITKPFISNLTGWGKIGPAGSWQSTGEGLEATVHNLADSFYLADNKYADFVYEANFTIIDGFDTAAAGLIFRCKPDPLEGCYLARVSVAGEVHLIKYYNYGKYDKPLDKRNLIINFHTMYNLRVTTKGTQITVYLNGEKLLQAYDAAYSSGAVGLIINSSTALFYNADITTTR